MQTSLLRNTASYIQLTWDKRDRVRDSHHRMGRGQQETNQGMLHKRNTEPSSSAMGLIIIDSSEGKARFPGSETYFQTLALAPAETLPSLPLGKDTELGLL